MMPRIAALLVPALGFAACSTGTAGQNGPTPGTSPEYAMAQSGADVIQTSVDGSRIYGPTVMLERDCDGMRGNGPSGVVDLRTEGNTLRGIVGTGATELHLEPIDEGGFTLRGLFAGALGRLDVRPDRLEGQLGRCQYNMRPYATELGVAYNGRRVCGSPAFQPVTVTLAPTIAAMEPIERAAILAVLLGR